MNSSSTLKHTGASNPSDRLPDLLGSSDAAPQSPSSTGKSAPDHDQASSDAPRASSDQRQAPPDDRRDTSDQRQAPPRLDLDQVHAQLADADAAQVVRFAAQTFGPDRLMLSSSFGAQAAVMLHLVTRIVPDIAVVMIDTGYLFPETYRFAQQLSDRLNLNLKVYVPAMTAAHQEAIFGKQWEQGPDGLDRYHQINKIEPMQRAIEQLKPHAWLAGLRAEQTQHRASLRRIELSGDIYKVHPILSWTTRDVHEYLKQHDLPYHPLYEQGYASIGDVHSSRPITAKDPHERATRFGGVKQECGLHLPSTREEDESRASADL